MKFRILIIYTFFCLFPILLKGQDPTFSLFFSNPLYLNPAFAGTSAIPRITLNYRNQWPRNGTSPTFETYSISYDGYVRQINGGLGLQLFHDNELSTVVNFTSASLFYSHCININKEFHVNAGLQATLAYKQFDPVKLIFPSMIDQLTGVVSGTLPDNFEYKTKMYPDFSVGIMGQYVGKRYKTRQLNNVFGGISVQHLNTPDVSLFEGGNKGRIPTKVTIHLGTRLHELNRGLLSQKFSLSPNMIYQQQGSFKQLNLGFHAYLIDNLLTLGVYHRNNLSIDTDALIFLAGLTCERIHFAYSYDRTLSKLSNYSNGSHEISLIFFIGKDNGNNQNNKLLIPPI